jgi:hypothetical protein
MEKNNKNKSFGYYLNNIEKQSDSLMSFPENNVSMSGLQLKEDVKQLRSALSGIRISIITLVIISIVLAIVTFISVDSYLHLKNSINVNLEATKDSLLNLEDKSSTLNYSTKNGKLLTYKDLRDENDILSDSLSTVKFLLDYAVESYDIKFEIKKKEKNTTYKISSGVLDQCYDNLEQNNVQHHKEIRSIVNEIENDTKKSSEKVDSILKKK